MVAFLRGFQLRRHGLEQRLLKATRVGRKGEAESGAVAEFAFGPGATAMALDDVFDDRKSQTSATLLAGPRFVQPVKSFEYPLQRLRRNTGAIDQDGDFNQSRI